MSHPFDAQRERALRILGLIASACQTYRDLLANVAYIRHEEVYGNPYWSSKLLEVYDTLGRSLSEASRNAVVRGPTSAAPG